MTNNILLLKITLMYLTKTQKKIKIFMKYNINYSMEL